MGLLKKIFKPISKVLDKVVPNEIKPFLPYAAAFAPVIAPGIMGAFGNSMLGRAAMGGGLNIFGQLAQEGNEGDINLLSAGLGALTGAMTAPADPVTGQTSADFFRSKMTPTGNFKDVITDTVIQRPELTGLQKAANYGLEGLAKGSEMFAAGMADPFSMAGLKAATLPAAQATGDLMFAQAKRDQDEYDRMMEEESEADAASDAQRAFAIRRAMEAQGATEEEIEDAIYAAGYKTGGRVGFRFGGIDAAIDKVEDESIKESVKMVADMPDMDLMDLIEEFEITFKRKPMSMDELKQFYRENYEMESPVRMQEKIKEKVTVEAKDGGRIDLREGGGLLQQLINPQAAQVTTLTQRPLGNFQPFAAPLQQAGAVFPRLNELEQGVGRAEESLGRIRSRLGAEQRQGLLAAQPSFGLQPLSMARLPGTLRQLANRGEPVAQGMKDGGMMDLGGKEMDLRKGGFVPIGKKERADDVPARLSKNEFVMTADAVRAAGGGSVNKGAKRMYNLMNSLEAKA